MLTNPGTLTLTCGCSKMSRYGPCALFEVGAHQGAVPSPWLGAWGIAPDKEVTVHALIDTGSDSTFVDLGLLHDLPVQLARPAATLTEAIHPTPVVGEKYMAQVRCANDPRIHVPALTLVAEDFSEGPYAALSTQSDEKIQAVLGRNFLEFFQLSYDGPEGVCEISGPTKSFMD